MLHAHAERHVVVNLGAGATQARIEAEAANRAKTEFLATISHEIRTPLMSIGGYADLITRTGRLSREHRRYIDLIQAANQALLTIVNDVLDFSKVEAGQLELQSRAFSLPELIHSTIAIVRPIVASKPITLKWSVDRRLPEWFVGDDGRLRQILLNLLNNAVKFTEDGSISVSVEPKLSPDGETLVLTDILKGGGLGQLVPLTTVIQHAEAVIIALDEGGDHGRDPADERNERKEEDTDGVDGLPGDVAQRDADAAADILDHEGAVEFEIVGLPIDQRFGLLTEIREQR